MTTKTNKVISTEAIRRAANMARTTGQNVIVYEAEVAKRKCEICVVQKVGEQSQEKEDIKFLAIIDENGNYVD